MELMGCPELAVPAEVMDHVVRVESSYNPFAIGVVGGRLARQPENLPEAVATARMLEDRGYNFSLGLAQVNRHNLGKYGLDSYEKAFDTCPNLLAGSRILAECNRRAGGDWDKSFSCYYSGNFVTGFRHGYVQKIRASMAMPVGQAAGLAIEVLGGPSRRSHVARPRKAAAGTGRAQAVVQARIAAPPSPTPEITVPRVLSQDTLRVRLPSPVAGSTAMVSPSTTQVTTAAAEPTTSPARQGPVVDAAFVF